MGMSQEQRMRVVAADMVMWRLEDVHKAVIRAAAITASQDEALRLHRAVLASDRSAMDTRRMQQKAQRDDAGTFRPRQTSPSSRAGSRGSGSGAMPPASASLRGTSTTAAGLIVVTDAHGNRRLVVPATSPSATMAKKRSLSVSSSAEGSPRANARSARTSQARRGSVALEAMLAEGTGQRLVDDLRVRRRQFRKELAKALPLTRLGFLEVFSDASTPNPAFDHADGLVWDSTIMAAAGARAKARARALSSASSAGRQPRRRESRRSLGEGGLFGGELTSLEDLRDNSVLGSEEGGSAAAAAAVREQEEAEAEAGVPPLRLLDEATIRAFASNAAAAAAAGLLGAACETAQPADDELPTAGQRDKIAALGDSACAGPVAPTPLEEEEGAMLLGERIAQHSSWRPAHVTRHLSLRWAHFLAFVMPPELPQPAETGKADDHGEPHQPRRRPSRRPTHPGPAGGVPRGPSRPDRAPGSRRRLVVPEPAGASRRADVAAAGQGAPKSGPRMLERLPRPGILAGHIDARELLVALALLCRGPIEGRMRTIFLLFDSRQRGVLSRSEAAQLLLAVLGACYRCGLIGARVQPREEDLLFTDLFLTAGEVVAPVGLASGGGRARGSSAGDERAARSGSRSRSCSDAVGSDGGGGSDDGGHSGSDDDGHSGRDGALTRESESDTEPASNTDGRKATGVEAARLSSRAADRDLVLWSFLPAVTGKSTTGLHAVAYGPEGRDGAAASAGSSGVPGAELSQAAAAAALLPEPVIGENGFIGWLRESPAAAEFLKLVEARRVSLIRHVVQTRRVGEALGAQMLREVGCSDEGLALLAPGGSTLGRARESLDAGPRALFARQVAAAGEARSAAIGTASDLSVPSTSDAHVPFDARAASQRGFGDVDAATAGAIAEQERAEALAAHGSDERRSAADRDGRRGGARREGAVGGALSNLERTLERRRAAALRHRGAGGGRAPSPSRTDQGKAHGVAFSAGASAAGSDSEDDDASRPYRNTLEELEFRGLMTEALLTEGGATATERLFRLMDLNADGEISFHEWLAGLALLTRGSKQERLRLIFEVWDKDNNGELDARELATLARSAARRAAGNPGPSGDDASSPRAVAGADEDMEWAEFADILVAMLDADGDGAVSQEDFAAACVREPALFECFARAVAPALASSEPLRFEFAEGLVRRRRARMASRARAEQVRVAQQVATLDFSVLRRVWSKYAPAAEPGAEGGEGPAVAIDQFSGRIRVVQPRGRPRAGAGFPASPAATSAAANRRRQEPVLTASQFVDFMDQELGAPAEVHPLLRRVHAFFARKQQLAAVAAAIAGGEGGGKVTAASASEPLSRTKVPLMTILNGVARAMASPLEERGRWLFRVLAAGAPSVAVSDIKALVALTRRGTVSNIVPRLAEPDADPESGSTALLSPGLSAGAVELACFGLPESGDRLLMELDRDRDGMVTQQEFAAACEVDPRLLQLLAVLFGGRAPRSRVVSLAKKQVQEVAGKLAAAELRRAESEDEAGDSVLEEAPCWCSATPCAASREGRSG
ncbi:hypothetical protein FNF31_00223 [Cafeteria roenbergensis]|uniref:EF-hand domain-containing protein n=1 Tax=Cafeteria roenbergensis TaxID=33653 RepID=A0A5A8DUG2_CAFRO|nr:hypothetical protein FNF31_00223 [Cafeteria roenbergensis]